MLTDSMGNQVSEAAAVGWDEQDTTARQATLIRILIRISREALQGASLD